MKAYVGGTYSDLKSYRQVAFEQLIGLGVEPIGNELLPAQGASLVDVSLRNVDEADLFILLVGHRYGFVPEGYDKSITHLEFERALERRIPILAFFLSDEAPVKRSSVELDLNLRKRLSSLKHEVRLNRIVSEVESPAQFGMVLVRAIAALPAGGDNKSTKRSPTKELDACREEVKRHKATIEDLTSKLTGVIPMNPIWRGRNFLRDELLCFALLPFKEDFFAIYETAISPAAEELGLKPRHAGEIFGTREVVEDIWDSICASRVVIVDVTGRNPNVFYELGICHTLGKDCIVIT